MPEEVVVSNFIHDIIDKELAEGYNTEVHTRFPPEPNGYLHIGSAKAIWINASTAEKYNGKFNLRYDDTNPAREDDEYVQSILRDIRWLGYEPTGGIFYGSDYFEKCYEFAEKLMVTRQTVSRWEAGTVMPDIEKIADIASLLEVSCDYLLKDEQTEDTVPVRGISRLIQNTMGKRVRLNFFDDEADIDLYDTDCTILDFEGNWMKVSGGWICCKSEDEIYVK